MIPIFKQSFHFYYILSLSEDFLFHKFKIHRKIELAKKFLKIKQYDNIT